jgi:3-hydroxyacyl-CoA dehydrogenase
MLIQRAAVLGAGTMGAQIAAHLANAGVPVLLLDVSASAAREGLERARRLKPDPFFVPDAAALVRTGSLDDLTALHDADWIVEAIVEDLEVKRTLLARVDEHRAPQAVVSSNTSGIPLAAIGKGRSDAFRQHWLGTHFFNPPRYLRLVEVIPTPETDPAITAALSDFLDRRLGKGVVVAKDTPAFIANRIGLFGLLRVLDVLSAGDYTIEEADAITGPAIGRPKSATLRTLDIAGLDILARVVGDLANRLPEAETRLLQVPPFVNTMLSLGLLGEKTGRGFYQRVKNKNESRILTLDLESLIKTAEPDAQAIRYRDRVAPNLPSLEAARSIADVEERIRKLFAGEDRAGAFLRQTLGPTLLYARSVAAGVAHSAADVDRAMRWGFGWERGPLETLDAIGEKEVLAACDSWLSRLPEASRHRPGGDFAARAVRSDSSILAGARQQSRTLRRNEAASLVDLGDGVLCVELHSKLNIIGADTLEMLHAGIAEAVKHFAALVVGTDAENFSAGANLLLLLIEAQEENWDEIDHMIRTFQGVSMSLKTCPVPVVAATAGLTLGGGCELCLHADRVQAAAETYMGLVEAGVGLIPAAGGTKEMLLRCTGASAADAAALSKVFENIGFARVSTSAPDARRLRYLRDEDDMTMNRDRLMADAKATALVRAREGYRPALPRTSIPVGGADTFAALSLGVHLAWRAGRLSDHDALIGRKLAKVLSGGDLPHAATVSEQYLLDLEREAFLSLCGEQKTQARIAYTLKSGKPLRN